MRAHSRPSQHAIGTCACTSSFTLGPQDLQRQGSPHVSTPRTALLFVLLSHVGVTFESKGRTEVAWRVNVRMFKGPVATCMAVCDLFHRSFPCFSECVNPCTVSWRWAFAWKGTSYLYLEANLQKLMQIQCIGHTNCQWKRGWQLHSRHASAVRISPCMHTISHSIFFFFPNTYLQCTWGYQASTTGVPRRSTASLLPKSTR